MTAHERNLRVGSLRLHVRDVGDGDPLLLLNGIGAHVGMWRPLEQALTGRRLIGVDAPGTGRSATPWTPRTMGALARLVEGVLDRLGLERVDVLGYSFGGALAQQLAFDAPQRVRRLVLAATFPGWGGVPGSLPALMLLGTPLRYHSRRAFMRTAWMMAGGRADFEPAILARRWAERERHPPTWRGYQHQLWTVSTWSSLRRLRSIAAPTLVVTGDDDPVVPLSNALILGERIPCARVLVHPGSGHFLLLEEAGAVVPLIADFLAAEDLQTEPVWQQALAPTADDLARQLRLDGLGALPWGLWSAGFRHLVGVPG